METIEEARFYFKSILNLVLFISVYLLGTGFQKYSEAREPVAPIRQACFYDVYGSRGGGSKKSGLVSYCSGSLVSPRIVLTAGHCIASKRVQITKLEIGCGLQGKKGSEYFFEESFVSLGGSAHYESPYSEDYGFIILDHDAKMEPTEVIQSRSRFENLFTQESTLVNGDLELSDDTECRISGYGSLRKKHYPNGTLVLSPDSKEDTSVRISYGNGVLLANRRGHPGDITTGGDSGSGVFCRSKKSPAWKLVGIHSRSNRKDSMVQVSTTDQKFRAAFAEAKAQAAKQSLEINKK